MFAVIKTGGKQYRVAANDTITIATVEGEPGSAVTFGEVLLFTDGAGATQVGAPLLSGISVAGEIVSHGRDAKVIALRSAAVRTRAASAVIASTTPWCASPASAPDVLIETFRSLSHHGP